MKRKHWNMFQQRPLPTNNLHSPLEDTWRWAAPDGAIRSPLSVDDWHDGQWRPETVCAAAGLTQTISCELCSSTTLPGKCRPTAQTWAPLHPHCHWVARVLRGPWKLFWRQLEPWFTSAKLKKLPPNLKHSWNIQVHYLSKCNFHLPLK